jgi:hypothetical protein
MLSLTVRHLTITEFLVQMRQGLSKAAHEAERLGKIGRLRLEVANLQRRRGRALRRAGEAVYQLGAGTFAVPGDVEAHLAQVREFEAEMAVKPGRGRVAEGEAASRSATRGRSRLIRDGSTGT